MESLYPSARRIVIIGATGAGKTTLAANVGGRLGIPHIDLDALHWQPNWTMAPDEQFQADVRRALGGEGWVVAGNYSKVRPLVWSQAELLVWLDYSLPLVAWRLFRRTLRRVATREILWGGNRETFRTQFLSRDSLFLWLLQTYPRRKREFPRLVQLPEYQHLRLLRFTHPDQAQAWLDQL